MDRTRWPLWLLAASLALPLAGCPGDDGDDDSGDDDTGDDDSGDDDPGDDDSTPALPDLPTGGCGAPEYGWVPLEEMGHIVDWEAHETDGFTAEALAMLLDNYGYGAFEPVYDVRIFRVRYVTQDRGEPVEATGILSYPILDEPAEVPSLLWLHGTSGFNDECAPSGMGVEGGLFNALFSSLGFAVASPDYLGMNGWGDPSGFLHPYVVAEPTAVASLDSLRALHRFAGGEGEDDLSGLPSLRSVFWGGSEGGFAAFVADRYAPRYAPEFDVVAFAAPVPPTDVRGLATHAVTVPGPTTLALAAVLTTGAQWYRTDIPLDTVFLDEPPTLLASSLPGLLADGCGTPDALDGIDSIEEVYQPAFIEAAGSADWGAAAPWGCFLGQSTIVDSPIPRDGDAPGLYVVAGEDDLVAADVGRADFPRLCEAGYRLEYLECAGAGHSDGAIDSLPYQWQWLRDRLDGVPLAHECDQVAPVDCSVFMER